MANKNFLSSKQLNTIRGKALVGKATPAEILSVFGHLDELELQLDELDYDDQLGTEGWRHRFNHPDGE
jgi:hypothetical protein